MNSRSTDSDKGIFCVRADDPVLLGGHLVADVDGQLPVQDACVEQLHLQPVDRFKSAETGVEGRAALKGLSVGRLGDAEGEGVRFSGAQAGC